MKSKCIVCEKPVDIDFGMGGCYVGGKPHCSPTCARITLGIPEPKDERVWKQPELFYNVSENRSKGLCTQPYKKRLERHEQTR